MTEHVAEHTAEKAERTSPRGSRALIAAISAPTGMAGLLLLAFFVIVALLYGFLIDGTSEIRPENAYRSPSGEALLGTDGLGRDVLARTLDATLLSLGVTLVAVGIGIVLGVPIGLAAGLSDGTARKIVAKVIGLGVAVPGVLVALVVVTTLGPGVWSATIAAGVCVAPTLARTAQNASISVAEEEFVLGAQVLGVSRFRQVTRYFLPNMAEALILQIGSAAQVSLLIVSSLSFLGLGVQPPQADWGRILDEGLDTFYTSPLPALVPGIMVLLAGLMFALLGEAGARSLNVQLRAAPPRIANHSASPDTAPVAAHVPADEDPLVVVRGLRITFHGSSNAAPVVDVASFRLARGELVGVVGESGSGKSLMGRAIAGVAPMAAEVEAEQLTFDGRDPREISSRKARRFWGTRLAVVFQDPMSSLTPSMRVGRQLGEKARVHLGIGTEEARNLSLAHLARVGLPASREVLRRYPHEFSGGMRQRLMIAMGLTTVPCLVIADEPTTALDVLVQRQILDLLRDLNREEGAAILFISHDLAVVSQLCTRVVVMYGGRVVEELATGRLDEARHPYTRALLDSVVDLETDRSAPLRTIRGKLTQDLPAVGCRFAPRCPAALAKCHEDVPALVPVGADGGLVACWNVEHRTEKAGDPA